MTLVTNWESAFVAVTVIICLSATVRVFIERNKK